MGIRDEMFRAKVLIFMVPLVLPIGQPPARATDGSPSVVECVPALDELAPASLHTTPAAGRWATSSAGIQEDQPSVPVPDTE
ncbi:MAG: hypothetical protein AAF086_09895 [Planctomycetota bacterium]